MANLDLLSSTSRVETPFIIAKIAGYSFGLYNKVTKNIIDETGSYFGIVTDYPNFMQSLNVVKINGSVNTYTLVMKYAIRAGDDPNLIDKVLSKAKNDRTMILTYGDCSIPSFIYKEEETIITDVKTSFDIAASAITYTINAVSKALVLAAGTFNFPACKAKPSSKIKELLYNVKYGLLDIFAGMHDKEKVLSRGLIVSDDVTVQLEAQKNVTPIAYLNYLVKCMRSSKDSGDKVLKSNSYNLIVVDDVSGEWPGTYFKVVKISNNINVHNSLDVYEIDVGFQGSNMVTNFSIDNDQAYAILYDYTGKTNQAEYIYRINDDGNVETTFSPNITKSDTLLKTTEAEKTWWTNITQYPISGTLSLKGLLRPAVLMTYIKINVLFYGQKHISSGYYIITQQTDTIDASGFRTQLKVTRVQGDN